MRQEITLKSYGENELCELWLLVILKMNFIRV